jgi:SAM-dependent methyltransferase
MNGRTPSRISPMNESKPADPYARIAELYDLEHSGLSDDVDFYLNFVEAVGDPVLELGCGTGRLLIPIAETGFRVTGIDRSTQMLDRARSAISERSLANLVTLQQMEMTDIGALQGGPFGVAIIGLNGLLHVTTSKEQRSTLASVRSVLDPRGQLLIDVFNPTPDVLRSLDHSLNHEGVWRQSDGSRIDKFSSRRVAPRTQTISTELWYDLTTGEGAVSRVATSFTMRYLHRAELELMLELAGFAEWQVYGSYDLDPFDDHSERLIVAAEVIGSNRAAS